MKLNELKLHDRNPRKISPEQLDKLVKSITDLSQMMELRPIVIDENNIILGGNMRYRALKKMGYKEIPDNWVKRADNLTEEQKREFIVKDNVGFGDWEIDILQEDYSIDELTDWGLDIDVNQISDEYGEEFTLKDGDKEPFTQQSYTLADEQAAVIKEAISQAKQLEEYKYIETFGNENSNGNALYLIIKQWEEQKK